MTPRHDFYKTLQVDPEAEAEIIAVAYKRLASKYHPDVNPAPDAGRRMRDLNAAFEVLSDPGRRAGYDAQRVAFAPKSRRSAHSAPPPPPPTTAALIVTPRSLPFGRVRRGTCPTARLEVGVPEGRTLIGEVRTTHPWIRLSVNRLFSDRTAVQVSVDTSDLEEGGHYTGAVVIDSVVFGSRSVPVSLNVAGSVKPVLRVAPTLLDFGEFRFGQPPKVIELYLENAGAGYLTGTVLPMSGWLSVSQGAFAGNSCTVQVLASAEGLQPGKSYSGEIALNSNGGQGVITALMDVAPNGATVREPARVPSRDLAFLEERLAILEKQQNTSSEQRQERNIIRHLLRTCRGGDVRDSLEKAIAAAQGAENIAWRDEYGAVQGTGTAVTVLSGLLGRLGKWQEAAS